jgi:hypothetical protein
MALKTCSAQNLAPGTKNTAAKKRTKRVTTSALGAWWESTLIFWDKD